MARGDLVAAVGPGHSTESGQDQVWLDADGAKTTSRTQAKGLELQGGESRGDAQENPLTDVDSIRRTDSNKKAQRGCFTALAWDFRVTAKIFQNTEPGWQKAWKQDWVVGNTIQHRLLAWCRVDLSSKV